LAKGEGRVRVPLKIQVICLAMNVLILFVFSTLTSILSLWEGEEEKIRIPMYAPLK